MKQTIQISGLIFFALMVVFPPAARSEIKITLKNGREIIAERCSESGGSLACEKSGGTFRIDKKDVLSTKNITIERREPAEEATPSASSADEGKDEPKDAEAGKAAEKMPEKAAAVPAEQDKRLADLNTRRAAYEAERETLMKEREQLHKEVKDAGVISTNGQYQYFDQKLRDLDARIKDFNEKVNKLNEEIGLVNSTQKMKP